MHPWFFFVLRTVLSCREHILCQPNQWNLLDTATVGLDAVDKEYPVDEVKRVFERNTLKGNGLRLELSCGRKKTLTLSTEYSYLGDQARTLNHFIQVARKQQRKFGTTDPRAS